MTKPNQLDISKLLANGCFHKSFVLPFLETKKKKKFLDAKTVPPDQWDIV